MSTIFWGLSSIIIYYSIAITDAQNTAKQGVSKSACPSPNGKTFCSAQAECLSNKNNHYCNCKQGYSGNGSYCQDINECEGNFKCHSFADCYNEPGKYRCTCRKGYEGNGAICTDVDECGNDTLNNCSTKTECRNTVGGYSCSTENVKDGTGQSLFSNPTYIIIIVAGGIVVLFIIINLLWYLRKSNEDDNENEDQIGPLLGSHFDTIVVPTHMGLSQQSIRSGQGFVPQHSQSLVPSQHSSSFVMATSPSSHIHFQPRPGRGTQLSSTVIPIKKRIVSADDVRLDMISTNNKNIERKNVGAIKFQIPVQASKGMPSSSSQLSHSGYPRSTHGGQTLMHGKPIRPLAVASNQQN